MGGDGGRYLTDGLHLYEIVEIIPNYGRAGDITLAFDSLTGAKRQMSELEVRVCREVTPAIDDLQP